MADMITNFALDLDHDGIRLLQRTSHGWRELGTASLDDPGLTGRLRILADLARALDGGELETEVIIPGSQILYTTVEVPGSRQRLDDDDIRSALEGRTPVPPDQLVFDWRRHAGEIRVAVLERRTLEEAEGFAAAHGFNPACFSARPGPDQFPEHPDFGPTALALVARGETPVPATSVPEDPADDVPPVKVTRVSHEADSPAAHEVEPDSPIDGSVLEDETPSERVTPTDLDEQALADVEEDEDIDAVLGETSLEGAGEEHDEDPQQGEGFDEVDADEVSAVAEEDGPSEEDQTTDDTENAPLEQEVEASANDSDEAEPARDDAPEAAEEDTTPALPDVSEIADEDRVDENALPEFTSVQSGDAPSDPETLPATDDEAPEFEETDVTEEASLDDVAADAEEAGEPQPEDAPAELEQEPVTAEESEPAQGDNAPVVAFSSSRPVFADPARDSVTAESVPLPPAPSPIPEVASPEKPDPSSQADRIPQAPPPLVADSEPPLAKVPDAAPKERRFPLGIALAAAAVVAALAFGGTLFFGARDLATSDVVEAEAAEDLAAAADAPEFDAPQSGALAPEPRAANVAAVPPLDPPAESSPVVRIAPPEALAPTEPQLDATPEELAETAPPEDADQPATVPVEIATEEAARTRYAVTGIWELPPPQPPGPAEDTLDALYLASIDEGVLSTDAVSLAALDETVEALFSVPSPPPPPGSSFTLDADGLVVATPEGALTPDGIVVTSGAPPVRPLPRPGRSDADSAEAEAGTVAELPRTRPRARPSDLAERNQRSRLGGRTLAELSTIRPRSRPVSDQIAAAEAVGEAPTDSAVSVSRRAPGRPDNFAITVAAIIAARTPAPTPEPAATAPAQPAPVVAAPQQPQIPTVASVARQATVENAINLRRLNLIGVYGQANDRRALVRLPSGRYVKVQVGDRIDGGQVAAIGETALRYTKGGRSILLEMPES